MIATRQMKTFIIKDKEHRIFLQNKEYFGRNTVYLQVTGVSDFEKPQISLQKAPFRHAICQQYPIHQEYFVIFLGIDS